MPVYEFSDSGTVMLAFVWFAAAVLFRLTGRAGRKDLNWMAGGCVILGLVQWMFAFDPTVDEERILGLAGLAWFAGMAMLCFGLWLMGQSREEGA